MKSALTPTGILSTLVLAAVLVAGCGKQRPGPEAEIRAWVDAMQEHAENEERREILSRIAEGYTDSRGNDREDINNTLRVWFLRRDDITLLVNIENIEVIAETAARVQLTVGMAGTAEGTFSFSADAYRFELELGDGDDGWELLSARWGELGQPLR